MRVIAVTLVMCVAACAKPQPSYIYLQCEAPLKKIATDEVLGTMSETFRVNDKAKTFETLSEDKGDFVPETRNAEFKGQLITLKKAAGTTTINRMTGRYDLTGSMDEGGKTWAVSASGKCEPTKPKF